MVTISQLYDKKWNSDEEDLTSYAYSSSCTDNPIPNPQLNTGINHITDPLNKFSSNQAGQSKPNIMLKVFSLNCCSIRSLSRRGKFAVLINEHNVNIVIGCESHIDESFATSEVFPSNFTVFRRDRSLGGGGVFLCFENTLDVSEEQTLQVDAELIWARLNITRNSGHAMSQSTTQYR